MLRSSLDPLEQGYYDQQERDLADGRANPFVRRRTVQEVMVLGEEGDRRRREQREAALREAEERERLQQEMEEKERARMSNPVTKDLAALRRRKDSTQLDALILSGTAAAASEMRRAHDFELDIDI